MLIFFLPENEVRGSYSLQGLFLIPENAAPGQTTQCSCLCVWVRTAFGGQYNLRPLNMYYFLLFQHEQRVPEIQVSIFPSPILLWFLRRLHHFLSVRWRIDKSCWGDVEFGMMQSQGSPGSQQFIGWPSFVFCWIHKQSLPYSCFFFSLRNQLSSLEQLN